MDKVIISAKSNIPEEKLYTEKVIKDLQAENERLKEHRDELINELSKFYRKKYYIKMLNYSQCLQEIRDIVSEQCQQCFVIDGFTKPDDCGICDYKRILAKINEVIGVE